jgi:hypothetical protein
MQRGSYESREDKTLKGDEGRRMEGGWSSNCMSQRRRNKGKGKVDGRIIRRRRYFSEEFWTYCEHRVLGLWLLIRGGTELLEVLGTEG